MLIGRVFAPSRSWYFLWRKELGESEVRTPPMLRQSTDFPLRPSYAFHNLQQNNLISVSYAGLMCEIEKNTCGNETT
jgi:hypothetical protein